MRALNAYENTVRLRTYSRFKDGSRESWEDAVNRYRDFFLPRVPLSLKHMFDAAIQGIKDMEVMPSMRALWSAGPALERENLAGFNCTYLPVESVQSFSEALYILMNGAGVGFSVESMYVSKLPKIPATIAAADICIAVHDSKEGWADTVNALLTHLYNGEIPSIDVSRIRPYGAPLKTFGGRASGPEPLLKLYSFLVQKFKERAGTQLTPLDAHDIMCVIANVVVSGGVRRAACISLSDLNDEAIAGCKDNLQPSEYHRFFANNSLVYTTKPSAEQIRRDMRVILNSGTGERGLFNRDAARRTLVHTRRDSGHEFGCNPCSEIILRPYQCCNLSEVVLRKDDTEDDILRKVKYATILGVLQSTLDKYKRVNPEWEKNSKEERLLGVSLTGLRDCERLNKVSPYSRGLLHRMRTQAQMTAFEWAGALKINKPAAITCCKPSGTVSQLVNSSSGLHPRFSKHYIRRIRMDKTDPLFKMLKDQGASWSPEVGQTLEDFTTAVLDFPVASPEGAVIADDLSAIEQLEYYKMLQMDWCEHKPSCTVYVGDEEQDEVIEWVVNNIDYISGVSFFPRLQKVYELAPYEAITQERYTELVQAQPVFDFSILGEYESCDNTTGAQSLACAGGACEL